MEEWKEPAEVLEVARERAAAENGDAESKCEDCDGKELNGEREASVEVPVPGRAPVVIGGGSGRSGKPPEMLSSDNLENIAIRVSLRGKMTVSLNLSRVIRRTSSSSPRIGIFLFAFGPSTSLSEGNAAPQKSAASLGVMIVPRPLNSRSRGRKTACMNGRMVLKTSIHMATRCVTSRSSGICRKVCSKDKNPVCSSSFKSSIMTVGARRWIHRFKCTETKALKSSIGGRGSSPSKMCRRRALRRGHASSGVMPGTPNAAPRLATPGCEIDMSEERDMFVFDAGGPKGVGPV